MARKRNTTDELEEYSTTVHLLSPMGDLIKVVELNTENYDIFISHGWTEVK